MSLRHALSTFCLFAAVALCAGIGGCQNAKPKPLAAPQATLAVEHFTGTPVSGALPKAAVVAQPEDALSVVVTPFALKELPNEGLEPLSAKTKLIVVTQSTSAVQPSPTLTLGARLATADQAAAFGRRLGSEADSDAIQLQTMTGAVAMGTTAVFAAAEPSGDVIRRVAIEVSRPSEPAAANAVRLALLVEDRITPASPSRDASDQEKPPANQPAPAPVFQRETVVIDDLQAEGPTQAVVVAPFRFAATDAHAIAFVIALTPGSQDPAHLDAVARCVSDLQRSAAAAAKRPEVGPLQIDAFSGLHGAIARLANPATRRATLVYLTIQTGAKLCGDVVLVADDSVLEGLVGRIGTNATSEAASQSPEAFGWMLDQATLQLLTELSGANKLPAEMSAVLTMHAGEAGRHASSLEEISRGLSSRQDFENRLIAENLIYLEDNSPASRVRAHDWLRGVGRAPANYDPLGSPRQRREALDRALTVAAGPSTQQAQP
jgi:hypothetical protein